MDGAANPRVAWYSAVLYYTATLGGTDQSKPSQADKGCLPTGPATAVRFGRCRAIYCGGLRPSGAYNLETLNRHVRDDHVQFEPIEH
eukprot:6027661-Amphidinium_carterae.1